MHQFIYEWQASTAPLLNVLQQIMDKNGKVQHVIPTMYTNQMYGRLLSAIIIYESKTALI